MIIMGDEKTNEKIREFKSCRDLMLYIKSITVAVKKSKNPFEEQILLKNAYVLAEQFVFSAEKAEEPFFAIVMTENPLQTLKLFLPAEKLENMNPLYKTFDYSLDEEPELTNNEMKKSNMTIVLNIFFDENQNKLISNAILKKIEPIDDVENKTERKEVLEIVKNYPYLIGFLGIKKMIIPVVFDDDSIFQKIKGIEYITQTGKGFSQFLTKVQIFNENGKQELKVPSFITKPKMFINLASMDKDTITLMRAMEYQVDNYTFKNTTTFIPLLFEDINKTLDSLQETNQISELKIATFINSDMIENYKKEIEKLVKSNPITEDDLAEISLKIDEIRMYTQLASILIKDKYSFEKQDLDIIKGLFNNKTLLSDYTTFGSNDVETLLSLITFYRVAKDKYKEYSENLAQSLQKSIKDIIKRNVDVPFDDFKKDFIKHYNVSEKKFEAVFNNVAYNSGYIEIRDEDEKDKKIILSESILTFLRL